MRRMVRRRVSIIKSFVLLQKISHLIVVQYISSSFVSSGWDSATLHKRFLAQENEEEKDIDWPLTVPLWGGCFFK